MSAVAEEIKRRYGQVSLCGLCQWEKNVCIDELVFIGRGRGKKTSVWTIKVMWVMRVERKRSCLYVRVSSLGLKSMFCL